MKSVISVLKVVLPLLFGVFLIWYVFKDLTDKEKTELFKAFSGANYFWILISVACGILSHVSRAIRWKYSIEPLGKTPGFWNSFYAVMIGYVANLALPRLGEVMRPGLLSKYEGISFNKLFGTIVAERVADLVILAVIMVSIILLELEMIRDGIMKYIESGSEKLSTQNLVILASLVILAGIIFLVLLFSKSNNKLLIKIRDLIKGVIEGVQSILKMKKKGYFLLHTLFIWLMYVAMFWVCFLSLDETFSAPIGAVLASFVMGSLAIVFVQGGLGVFPIAIMETLLLYGYSKTSSLALGWIIWTSQTLMVIIIGILSLILIRIVNKDKIIDSSSEHSS